MRNLLSSLFFILIFVALGAMAFAAAPRGDVAQNEIAAQPGDPLTEAVAQEDVPAAVAANKTNALAIPLDVQSNWSAQGISFDAYGLAEYVSASGGVVEVSRYNSQYQSLDVCYPGSFCLVDGGNFDPNPFSLEVGGNYWIKVNDTVDTSVSFVGDVPAQGTVDFALYGDSPCRINAISVPLDQSSITNANELAAAIEGANTGAIQRVSQWNATYQSLDVCYPGSFCLVDGGNYDPTPFEVKIGYPYWVCAATVLDGSVWPSP